MPFGYAMIRSAWPGLYGAHSQWLEYRQRITYYDFAGDKIRPHAVWLRVSTHKPYIPGLIYFSKAARLSGLFFV